MLERTELGNEMFEVMPKDEIIRMVDWGYENDNYTLLITLIDGTSLVGWIPYKITRFDKNGERPVEASECCYTNDAIILVDERPFEEKDFYIPFDKIAGISATEFEQESIDYDLLKEYRDIFEEEITDKIDTSLKLFRGIISQDEKEEIGRILEQQGIYHNDKCFIDAMMDDLFSKCQKKGFRIDRKNGFHYSLCTDIFAWGELKFKRVYPMYTDWDYLSRVSGGINSIGGGFVVSGSVAWEKSLYSVRKRIMKKRIKSLSDIDKTKEDTVIIGGYIDHVYIKKGKKKKTSHVQMEGFNWFPVIISEEPIRDENDLVGRNWCVGYMRESCMQVPKLAFEETQTPLRIQGELMPMSVKTPFGESDIVIKIRNISSTRMKICK